MKKNLLLLLLTLALTLCATAALASGYYYIDCDGSSVNMREGPSSDYDIICYVPFGAQVYVDDFAGGSYASCSYNGYYGYISWSFLSSTSPVPDPGPTYGPLPTYVPAPTSHPVNVIATKYVTTDNRGPVNVRSGPSTNSGIVVKAPFAAQVSVYSYSGSWANVSYNGYYGYVNTRYLSDTKPGGGSTPTAAPAPVPAPTAAPAPVSDLTALFEGFVAHPANASVAPSSQNGTVHLRWAPSKDAPVILDLEAGHTLHSMFDNGVWAFVYDQTNDVSGFMMMEFLNFSDGVAG